MKRILWVVGALVALGVIAAILFVYRAEREAAKWAGPVKEIVSEKMEKVGDTWHIEFVSTFDAPIARVFEAFSHPERAHDMVPDKVLKSELKSQRGRTKVVELYARVLSLPLQVLTVEYTIYPEDHRITTRTLDYPLADIRGEYRFESSPDGRRTMLRYTSTARDRHGNPLPESVQKGALKESYVIQVRAVERALGLATGSSRP